MVDNSTDLGLRSTQAGLPSGKHTLANPNKAGNGFLLSTENENKSDWNGELQILTLKESPDDVGINFPGILFKEEQTKDLVLHTFPNVDGARIENMGRNPGTYMIKAILTNNIYPGHGETWRSGQLFPDTFRSLINLLQANNPKVFQHPVYGNLPVQVKGWSYELNAKGPRDGAFLEISLIETILGTLLDTIKPKKGANLAKTANDLDSIIDSIPQHINPPGLSLSQFFGKVAGLITQVLNTPTKLVESLNADIITGIRGGSSIAAAIIRSPATLVNAHLRFAQNTKNAVLNSTVENAVNYDATTYRAVQSILGLNNTPSKNARQLIDKLLRALFDLMQHYTNQNTADASPVIEAIRQLIFQVQNVDSAFSANILQSSVKVATYTTVSAMTWMQLARFLNNSIDALMNLNQELLNQIWLPANTIVFYYQS